MYLYGTLDGQCGIIGSTIEQNITRVSFFFFNDRAPPELSPLPLHDPLPIPRPALGRGPPPPPARAGGGAAAAARSARGRNRPRQRREAGGRNLHLLRPPASRRWRGRF